jgi:mono/diheme cytochrome c family protein
MPLPSRISKSFTGLLHATLAVVLFLSVTAAFAQKDDALYAQGEKLFKGNCAACHKPDKDMTGPALKGAKARWEGKGDIYSWVKNSSAYIATGNSYAKELFEKWNKSVMTSQALTDAEIDAVLHYTDNFAPPAPAQGGPVAAAPVEEPSTAWQWLLVLGLLFLVVVLSLGGVKHQLANAVREVEGKQAEPETGFWGSIKRWAWANKGWASVISLLLVVFLIVQAWDWAFNIGVYGGDTVEHYKPEQPIRFNHTIHAGKADKKNLQINCVYCHSSAEKSKHAGIPSANVCMNCHQAVNESARNPWSTEEIKKIYSYTGWDGKAYTGTPKPIEWVKVHNLPDHVAFSHATHVSVGKIECQKCHGPIDEQMDVAEQWAPLTMGWCIQCHNETEVQMAGNGYYDEIHRRLKETPMGNKELREYLEDEKITVKELGGWECAKCHY